MKYGLLPTILAVFIAPEAFAQEACDEARAVWADVKDSGSEAALQSFADAFSQCGIYSGLALEALQGLEATQPEIKIIEAKSNYTSQEMDCLHTAGATGQISDFSGVAWSDIETDWAIETCEAANSPKPEVQAAFSRALYKAEQYGYALDLATTAAEGGSGLAMNTLGVAYSRGDAVTQNDEQAFHWYSKAAATGFPMGQYNAAGMYLDGEHVEKNLGKAIELYTLAADSKYTSAQDALGDLYRTGEEVPKDLDRALHWYQQAILSGEDTDAMFWSARIYAGHSGDFPIDEIHALELYERAAFLGDRDAQHSAAQVYFHGYGVEKDHILAAHYFEAAAQQGHVKAMRKHGRIEHETGNVDAAIYWYSKAAEAGDDVAQQLLDEIIN